jgi:sphingomyelin phosphodiesterase acid-like 3
MNKLKLRMVALVVFWGVALTPGLSVTQAAPTRKVSGAGWVVSISDIHFNPFYDPKLVASLIQSDYRKWQGIFTRSGVAGYGSHSADTNYNLLNSALENIYLRAPRPDFIIISGDFLAHDFQETYAKLAGSSDPKAVDSFIDKTIAFVTWVMARRFPKTPVYPALGNNDSYCGDYQVEPAGRFLRATAQTWKGLLNSKSNARVFLRTFPVSGSYSAIAPHNRNHRIIVLNTTFFSSNYKNTCGDPGAEPGNEEMKWLATELENAAAAKERVWLVYHIPAGVDVFATVNNSQAGQAVSLWQPAYNQQFIDLVTRYSSVIAAAFAGHIHMDSFQLVQSNNQAPASFVHITPAFSPLFGNKPAFDVFTYDRRLAALKDYSAYYFNLSSPASQKNAPVKWSKEYSFAQAFAQPDFSAPTLQAVYSLMPANQNGDLTKYEKYYNVSNTASPGFDPNKWRAYWCGIGNLTVSTYLSCISNATSRQGAMIGK